MNKVAVIIGSLRKESFNRKLAHALGKLNHPNLQLELLKIDEVPLYNQDLEHDLPAAVVKLKNEIVSADAVLFVTPEYNRSIPGVLKNIIDWGTRPYGQNSWKGKPVAMVGTSPGVIGTAVAQSHLRSVMAGLNTVFLGQPEVYLVYRDGLIGDDFTVTDEKTRQFLQSFLDRFSSEVASYKSKS